MRQKTAAASESRIHVMNCKIARAHLSEAVVRRKESEMGSAA